MLKMLIACTAAAGVLLGALLCAAMKDPHDQIVDGIKAAQEACQATEPRTDYERRVCALVAP